MENISLMPTADSVFAKNLSKENMLPYYQKHGIGWDDERFNTAWNKTENFMVKENDIPIGIFRTSTRDGSFYINDMQIASENQGKGIGTYVLRQAEKTARERKFASIALSVFEDNPAYSLYKKFGFKEIERSDGLVKMRKNI